MKGYSRIGKPMKAFCHLLLTGLLLVPFFRFANLLGGGVEEGPSRLPADFEQLLPRGTLASIDDPSFVTADEAEIADESWVLGVVIDGQAKAYSLAILNSHEVVNDVISDQPVAAVW